MSKLIFKFLKMKTLFPKVTVFFGPVATTKYLRGANQSPGPQLQQNTCGGENQSPGWQIKFQGGKNVLLSPTIPRGNFFGRGKRFWWALPP